MSYTSADIRADYDPLPTPEYEEEHPAVVFDIEHLDAFLDEQRRCELIDNSSKGAPLEETMGLPTVTVTDCRERHPDAVSNKNPCTTPSARQRPTMFACDMEELTYTINPDRTPDTDSAKMAIATFLKKCIEEWAPTCTTYNFAFDQRSNDSFCITKQVHTGDERSKARAYKIAVERDEYESLTESEKKNTPMRMIVDMHNRPLPKYWNMYMSTREGRWSIYQLVVWTILDPKYFTLPVGKVCCFYGLPFHRSDYRVTFDSRNVHGVLPVQGRITEASLKEDPELFSKCLMAQGVAEPGKNAHTIFLHWDLFDTNMWEADYNIVHVFKFSRDQHWLVRSNDRDMLLTLLVHSIDRRRPGGRGFTGEMYLMCPNKSTGKKKGGWKGDYFWDINRLYDDIDNDPQMSGHIYNRVLTYVFVMILCGCDHVRKDLLFNVGKADSVLSTLFTYSERYQNMVQLSKLLIPDPSAVRFPLVDERAAMDFVTRCYLVSYGTSILKKRRAAHASLVKKRAKSHAQAVKKWTKACDKIDILRIKYAKQKYGATTLAQADALNVEYPQSLHYYPEKPTLVETPPFDERVTRADVQQHIENGKAKPERKAKSLIPTRNQMRMDIRNAVHSLYTIFNVGRDQAMFEAGGRLDPCALGPDGVTPYWGYEPDPSRPGKYRASSRVHEEQDIVSLCYPQSYVDNMFRRHTARVYHKRKRDQATRVDGRTDAEKQLDLRRKKIVGARLVGKYRRMK